ncbi:hypothetical protein CSA37_07160 [Candidatus Fermentibacteria bacterium]|nr:MAG: hypothetical protein CSA37_10055 [Candidatus Fermentibacteria bacterium]PIE52336.1 MAG: hypothetical protein CSA37_07160 [Candidatus Fermentibacteria bacterium]
MSLEAILARIETDAREKAEQAISAAEAERDKALQKVKASIKSRHHKDVERVKNRVESRSERMKHHIHRNMEKALLSHRRQIVDQAITDAVIKISEATDYLEMIESLLSGCDLSGEVEIIVNEKDAGRISAEFLKKASDGEKTFTLSEERHTDHGGVIMRCGHISLNATLSMIAELNHDSMVMELSRLLPLEGQGE